MRLVIQRVKEASVRVDGEIISQINSGLLILVGIENSDTTEDIEWLTNKCANLRIFDDSEGVMNLSLKDIDGEVLAVSQFTLYAAVKKGNRPSYIRAAGHSVAIPMYNAFCETLSKLIGKSVKMGKFGADMKVSLLNDGPVTILVDSKNRE